MITHSPVEHNIAYNTLRTRRECRFWTDKNIRYNVSILEKKDSADGLTQYKGISIASALEALQSYPKHSVLYFDLTVY